MQTEAEALFWIGTYHQVLHLDGQASIPFLDRAEELALRSGDKLLDEAEAIATQCGAQGTLRWISAAREVSDGDGN